MQKPNPEEVCICFHVSLAKLEKFCRLHQPSVASQLSECYSAGTGCGWCVPFLEKIHEQVQQGQEPSLGMSAEEYQARRSAFRATGERPES